VAAWKIESGVEITVLISGLSPLDPFGPPIFDVTDYVRGDAGVTIRRGRSSEFDSFQPGTCTFELKNDGRRFDPSYASSPFLAALKPNRGVVVTCTWQGVGRVLFAGFVEGWPQTQERADVRPTVQVVAKDLMSVMARTRISDLAFVLDQSRLDIDRLSGSLPEQFTGERVEALLGLAGFASNVNAELDRGKTIMPASGGGADLLSAAQTAEMSEAGFLYVAGDGAVTFLDRHSRFEDTRLSTVQATFTQAEYQQMTVDHDLVRTWNDVRFSSPAGDPQTARDQTSVDEYGVLTYPESGGAETLEVLSDGEALGRAMFWRDRFSTPQPRPSPIVVKPRKNMASLFAKCIDRELLDRVEIHRTPQGVGSETVFTGLVDQVVHSFTNSDWTTTLAISPFEIADNEGFLVLDHSTLGNLDQERLAY